MSILLLSLRGGGELVGACKGGTEPLELLPPTLCHPAQLVDSRLIVVIFIFGDVSRQVHLSPDAREEATCIKVLEVDSPLCSAFASTQRAVSTPLLLASLL